MKKYLVIVVFILGVLQAQTPAHIHHLYGLKESAQGVFTLDALDQKNGNSVEIETYTMDFQLGSNYAYQKTTNTVVYIDSTNSQNFSLLVNYQLPSIYESGYQGFGNILTFQNLLSTVAFKPNQDSILYSYNLNSREVMVLDVNTTQTLIFSDSLNDDFEKQSLNSTIYNDEYFLSGNILGTTFTTIYRYNTTTLTLIDTVTYPLDFVYLTSDVQTGVYGIAPNTISGFDLIKYDDVSNSFINIGSLPSCSACATETFSYDKNAMVIDPENNQLIVSRSETISGATQHYLSTFNLADASMVYNIATPERYSNLSFHKPLPGLVYPGDANHDKLVTMQDILPIGIWYNDFVDARLEISTDWIGQNAINMGDTLLNGVDIKHADCNGDAQINTLDIDNAILTNYSYVHYSEKSTNANCDFPLYVNFPSNVKEDEAIEIEIGLDLNFSSVQDVYGVIFTLEYDTNFVVNGTMNTQGVNTWFGTEDLNFIQRNVDDYPQAKMDVGVVGIDKLNRNGGGVLVTGIWTMEDEVIPIMQDYEDMNIKIKDVYVIDYNQNVIDACGLDTFIRVYDETIGIQEKENLILDLYPNPSNESYISINNIENLETVEIYDLHGKLLKSNTENFSFIDISHFSKGVYIVKAYAGKKVYINKLMLSRQ